MEKIADKTAKFRKHQRVQVELLYFEVHSFGTVFEAGNSLGNDLETILAGI